MKRPLEIRKQGSTYHVLTNLFVLNGKPPRILMKVTRKKDAEKYVSLCLERRAR